MIDEIRGFRDVLVAAESHEDVAPGVDVYSPADFEFEVFAEFEELLFGESGVLAGVVGLALDLALPVGTGGLPGAVSELVLALQVDREVAHAARVAEASEFAVHLFFGSCGCEVVGFLVVEGLGEARVPQERTL